jgi:hypothetical protein
MFSFEDFLAFLQYLKAFDCLTHRRFLIYLDTRWDSFGQVISQWQRPLPTQDNTMQKYDRHPCFKRDSNTRSQCPSNQGLRLRPRGKWDRLFEASFIHFLDLEHTAPFGVSVITHTLRRTMGYLCTSDQPVAETSTYTGQHNM